MQRTYCGIFIVPAESTVAPSPLPIAIAASGGMLNVEIRRKETVSAGNWAARTAPTLAISGSRGLAWALGSLLDVHLDLLGFGFRPLRQLNFEHSLVIMGAYLLWINSIGQCE